jgi:Flp pilus assembly protein TadD
MSTVEPPLKRSVRRRRWFAVATLMLFFLAGGYFGYRSWVHSEKRAALALAASAEPDQAIAALQRCLERDPEDPELLKAIVDLMVRNNWPIVDTEPYVNRWIAASPNDIEAYLIRIQAHTLLDRNDEAIRDARRVLELAPQKLEPRMLLASLHAKTGHWDDAAEEYRRLVDKGAPIEASIGLARAELERGRRREALLILDGVLLAQPQSFEAQVLRGRALILEGDFVAALATFQQCRPPSGEFKNREIVLFYLGQCLERLNRAGEAKTIHAELRALQDAKALTLAGSQRPDDVELQTRVAQACLAAGIPEEALKVIDRSLERFGSNRKLLLAAADCYEKLGRRDDARQARLEAEKLP